jgi:hypothetical protein
MDQAFGLAFLLETWSGNAGVFGKHPVCGRILAVDLCSWSRSRSCTSV